MTFLRALVQAAALVAALMWAVTGAHAESRDASRVLMETQRAIQKANAQAEREERNRQRHEAREERRRQQLEARNAAQEQRRAAQEAQQREQEERRDAPLLRLAEEAVTLPADKSGADRWLEITRKATPLLSFAAPQSREIFQTSMQKADTAVIAVVLPGLIDEALAQARGVEGLNRLERQTVYGVGPNRYVRFMSPEGQQVRNESGQRLREGRKALAALISEGERERIDRWDTGMSGLSDGVQWRAAYDASLAPHAPYLPPLEELLAYFRQKRAESLRANHEAFRQMVAGAASREELASLKARFLLEEDRQTAEGNALLAMLAEREEAADRAMALGRPLKTSAPQDGASPVAMSDAAADVDPDGGPSEEVMYDLLRSVLVTATKRQNELMAQCSSGPRSDDPLMNQLCLGVMLYRGMTAGLTANAPVPRILEFERLGCAPAAGKPGYFCEYMLAVEKQLNPAFVGPEAKALLEDSALKSARFVRSRSKGWYIIHNENSTQ